MKSALFDLPCTLSRHGARVALLISLCALCGALTHNAAAASFDDYRARVSVALNHATDLYGALEDKAAGTLVADARAAQSLAALRQSLPPKEHVEWAGGGVDADNGWLHKELDAYAALSADKRDERRAIISRVVERLGALNRQLDETARATTAARDKEAEKGKLQSILRRPEYNEQAARGGAIARLWDWIKSLLEKLLPRTSPMSPGASSALSVVARLFVYALAVALIAFVAWRYGPMMWSNLSTRRKKTREREARIVLGERLAPDETAADLIAEAERLARAGDLRGAIRKAYIAVLCELGDRKLIRLAQHKTNRDYLLSVREHAELYGALRPLTNSFERHWYGFAPATDADWNEYRGLCQQAIST
ncbi:MAG: hypothetical protein QOF61_2973 [Acidobacteriota bacterium]|jgi:hypothetical protein|nr:hypothetical protein [Acidobacteriota bacterium]